MENLLKETKNIMKKYNIKANKSLGQNFLIDESVVQAIVDCSKITEDDLIIEIGPGLGTMTELLLKKAKKIICIELDNRMIRILNERFLTYNNLRIINKDVLKLNLNEVIKEEKEKNEFRSVKIVANLPYYITTPIIMKLLEDNLDIESITVMIQKEVAERLIATPGDKETGAITYSIYYYCSSEKIMEVPNTAFVPAPEVTSEIIKLNLRKEPPIQVKDEKLLFNIIKSAFMQRRKTLINSLTNVKVFKNKEEGIKILNEIGLGENVRAEQLTLEDFGKLSENFMNNL